MNKYAICCKIFSLETRIKRKRSKGARNAKLEARGLYLLSQHSTLEIIKQTVPIFLSQSFAPALQKHPPEHVQVSQPPAFPPFSRPCLLYSWANISETSKSFCRERKGGEGECWIKSISKRIGGDESWNSTVKLLCSKSLRDANIKGEPGSRLHVQSKLTEAYYPIRALSSLSKGGKFRTFYPFCLWFARSLFTHVQIGANPCTTFPGLMFALNRRMNPTESLRLGFALYSSNFRPRVCVFRLYKSLLWRFLLPASPFPMMFRIV